MKFNEAMEALKKGQKVTRQQMLGSMYFLMDGDDVKSYQPFLKVYTYDEDIMISDGWIVDGEKGTYSFADLIEFLLKGKTARLQDWKEMYIKYEPSAQYLVLHAMDVFPYQPDFSFFTATDWMIIE